MGSVVLEVAIGLGFVYLILSLICSTVLELIAQFFALRSTNLYAGIKNLLEDPNLKGVADKVYQHPLVKNLAKEGKKPSYIPARNFCSALLDVLKAPQATGGPLSEARNTVSKLPNGPLRQTLSALIEDSGTRIEDVRESLESWFDDSMDRVGGWYKRKAQIISLAIALGLAVGLNVSTIRVAEELWTNPTLRAQYVALAEQQAAQPLEDREKEISELAGQLDSLPIGWSRDSEPESGRKAGWILASIVGWIMTALAVSLGAPFWFDALGKLVNLRSAGQAPKKAASTSK